MKTIFTAIIFTLLSAALISCQPEAMEADVPQAPEKLVISSQLLPGDMLAVTVSRSFSALKKVNVKPGNDDLPLEIPEELLVSNASVIVQASQGDISLNMIYPGIYVAENIMLNEGSSYTLRISDPQTGESVVSVTPMMSSVYFDTVSVQRSTASKDQYQLYYRFPDREPAKQNWYVINYYTKDPDSDTASSNPLDIDNIARRMLDQKLDFDLVSDADMKDGVYSISKKFTSNDLDTFGITLSNISPGYYEFLKQHKKAKALFNRLKGEVVNLPTNVSNGYGYFNLFIPDVKVITLGKKQ